MAERPDCSVCLTHSMMTRVLLLCGQRRFAGFPARVPIRQAGDAAVFQHNQSFAGRARDDLRGNAVALGQLVLGERAVLGQQREQLQPLLRPGAARAVEVLGQRGFVKRGTDDLHVLFVLSAHDAHALLRQSRGGERMQRGGGFVAEACEQLAAGRFAARIAQVGVDLAGKAVGRRFGGQSGIGFLRRDGKAARQHRAQRAAERTEGARFEEQAQLDGKRVDLNRRVDDVDDRLCVFVFGRLRELDDHGQQAAVAVPEGYEDKAAELQLFPLLRQRKVDIPAVQRIGRFQQVHADKAVHPVSP